MGEERGRGGGIERKCGREREEEEVERVEVKIRWERRRGKKRGEREIGREEGGGRMEEEEIWEEGEKKEKKGRERET